MVISALIFEARMVDQGSFAGPTGPVEHPLEDAP